MNDHGVYDDEMLRKRPSDRDVERILSGQAPEDASLSVLGPVLIALHDHGIEPLSEARVATLAAEAAAIARETKPDRAPVATPPSRSRNRGVALRGKLAMVAVAVIIMGGMTGVATASDEAAPGDLLYGLDRALESVGINDGGPTERITEAQALAGEGQVMEAIDHVAAAVEESDRIETTDDFSPESTNAATALRDAAASVRDSNTEPGSQEVRDAVGAMLSEMAEMIGDPDLDGAEFGQRVSDMARSITNRNSAERGGEADQPSDNRPDQAGPPDGNEGEPSESPEGTPGAGGSGGGPPGEGPAGDGPPGGGPPGGGPPGRPGGR